MYKKSKVFVAACLTVNMLGNSSVAVLAQDFPADSEEVLLEDDILEEEAEISEEIPEDIEVESEDAAEIEEIYEEEVQAEVVTEEMPEEVSDAGMILTSAQKSIKGRLREHAVQLNVESLDEGKDYVSDEVITLADSLEQAQLIAKAYGGELESFMGGVATINLAGSDLSVATAYELGMDENSDLPAVVPNYITALKQPIADVYGEGADFTEYYGNGWDRSYYEFGYNDPYLNPNSAYDKYQWFHDAIHSYSAWGLTTGNPDITVAVIDTGILATHEDLSGRIILPVDFKINLDNGTDKVGRGTAVAGIIAANAGNKVGGAGVAPGVSVMAINASSYDEQSKDYVIKDSDLITAINYVAGTDKSEVSPKKRANIINMSFASSYYDPFVEQAVKKAHDAGVTIVASMGDSASNDCRYPACYDGVIAVGATNEGGERAYFSSYGASCDIAAPGQNITSTDSSSKNSYKTMSETAIAVPVVSGACALYMSVYGHQDPDTMERVLKTSASKISAKGLGAGMVDLAKMFGANVTPPTVTLAKYVKGSKEIVAKASGNSVTAKGTLDPDLRVEFDSDYLGGDEKLNKETKIIYTVNGQNPAVKNGVVTTGEVLDYDMWHDAMPSIPATTALKLFFYDYSKPLTVTLKAAFLSGTGVMSKVTTVKFTIVDESIVDAQNRQQIEITGQDAIVPGTSASFKTVFYENYTHTKTVKARPVDWQLDNAAEAAGAVIAPNGKLTVPAGFKPKSIEVRAVCKDNITLVGYKSITLMKEKADSVKIDVTSPSEFNDVKRNPKNNSVTKVTLFSSNIDGTGFAGDETELVVRPEVYTKAGIRMAIDMKTSYFTCTSSNKNVVRIDRDSDTGAFVAKAVSAGTSTVTFTAGDGSKKKAAVKVTVINPASGVALSLAGNQVHNIAYGKSATVKANLGDTYGKPSVKKVDWSYRIGFYNSDLKETFVSDADAAALIKLKAFTFSKGKITAGKQAVLTNAIAQYSPYNAADTKGLLFEVTAGTTDGTGYKATDKFYVDSPRTRLVISAGASYEISEADAGKIMEFTIDSDGVHAYEVISSNPTIVSGYTGGHILYVVAYKKGSATLTVKALDGSGKTAKLKVKVN